MNKLTFTFLTVALCCLALQVSADAPASTEVLAGDESLVEFGLDKSAEDTFMMMETSAEISDDLEDMDEKAVGGRRPRKSRKPRKGRKPRKARKGKNGGKKRAGKKGGKKGRKGARKAAKKGRKGARKGARKGGRKGGRRGGRRN